MDTPPGADAQVFARLKDALHAELLRAPSAAGQGLAVTDLAVTPAGGSALLEWTYRNMGDYDQNSEVNISDLSPLGLYFGLTSAAPNWPQAQVADGDSNGVITIADVTPIGANFGTRVTGYLVERTLTPADPGSWDFVALVPFSSGFVPLGEPRSRFEFTDPDYLAGMEYRVTAQWTVAGGGGNQPPLASIDADVTSGQSPLTVNFDASASSDPDGTIVQYEWDWDGDGAFDFDSGSTPTAQVTYSGAPPQNYSATVRVTDSGGLSDTASITITLTDGSGFVEPPVESYVDFSQPGDPAERVWLLNSYATLPPWQDADRVFQTTALRQWADDVLALTNAERAANGGLAPLVWDPHLELVAQAHARDMALRQYFAHVNPDGLDPFERLAAVDQAPWLASAENLYAGVAFPLEDSPAQAVTGWMNSPGHRANILNPDLASLGVGVYYHTGDPSGFTAYFVQVFSTFQGDPNAWDWLEPEEVN